MAVALRHRHDDLADVCTTPTSVLVRTHFDASQRKVATIGADDNGRRLAFTGHLHNADDLRRRFRLSGPDVQTDAGLVLRLVIERGTDVVRELDGSFAFALHDQPSGDVVLANDRFASRPLYWSSPSSGVIVFGTQVNAVLQSPQVRRTLDRRAVRELFHYQRVHQTRTLHESVAMLAPGTLLEASSTGVKFREWFSLDYCPEAHTQAHWADEMAEVFRRSTRRSLERFQRPGLFLSGGLDSRMVVAASEVPLQCFHFNDQRNREYEVASQIAASRGFRFDYLERPVDHYLNSIEPAVSIGSAQYGFIHSHSIGLLPEGAADVMLHGYVPELLFRGTNLPHRPLSRRRFTVTVDPTVGAENIVDAVASRLKYSLRRRRPARFFSAAWSADFDQQMMLSAEELVHEARSHSADPLDWFTWADVRYQAKYPSFLFEDAIRAYHEERSVVLHNEVLDLHLRMPVSARSNNEVWLAAMRRLSPAVASIRDANTGRSPFGGTATAFASFVRAGLRSRFGRPVGVTGSWPDFGACLVSDPRLRQYVIDLIRDPAAIDPEIFDVPTIEQAMRDHDGQRVADPALLLLATTFGVWHRHYGPGTSVP